MRRTIFALFASTALTAPAFAQSVQSKSSLLNTLAQTIVKCASGQTKCIHPDQVQALLSALIASVCTTNSAGDCVLPSGAAAANIGPGGVGPTMLAPGAAATNLMVSEPASYYPAGVPTIPDGQQQTFTTTAAASSNSVTLTGGSFSTSDVGKLFRATGLGATLSTGSITAAPVAVAGAGYTSRPTISLSGTSATAFLRPNMAIDTPTVASGGSGCPNGTQTWKLPFGPTETAAYFTGTVSGGVLSGALTVTSPGVAYYYMPTTGVPLAGPTCATQPTVNVTYHLGSIFISNGGHGVPLSGVTASISGGSPGTAATLGSLTVTPTVTVLKSTIASVTDATHIVLADPVQTAQSGTQQIAFWGHDDGVAINSAVASGRPAYLPVVGSSPTTYWTAEPISIASNQKLIGAARDMVIVRAMPGLDADVVTSAGAEAQFGTITTGTSGVGVESFTIDGNASAQDWPSGGSPDTVNGLVTFGVAFHWHDMLVQNVLGHCLKSGGNTANLALLIEADERDVATASCGRHGYWNAGPNDKSITNMIIRDASQEMDAGWDGFWDDPSGVAVDRIYNLHPWHSGVSNRMAFDAYITSGNQLTGEQLEGGRQILYISGSTNSVTGGKLFNPTGPDHSAMVVNAGTRNTDTGNTYENVSYNDALTPVYAIQFGTSGASSAGNIVASVFNNFGALTPFNFVNDGGNNNITSVGAASSGGATNFGGSISTNSRVNYVQWGTQIGTQTLMLGQLPVSAASGGKYLCVDQYGQVYQKSACP